ncbi:hypothetical protein TrVFT333_009647 [Trichoderma virens FT-333]|nr:hypothetical protein TrVFT333_009647 [Trichoderma virens FT-333]
MGRIQYRAWLCAHCASILRLVVSSIFTYDDLGDIDEKFDSSTLLATITSTYGSLRINEARPRHPQA